MVANIIFVIMLDILYPIGVGQGLVSAPFKRWINFQIFSILIRYEDMHAYSHNNISRNIIPHFSPHTPLPACYELSVASCVSKNNNTE